MLKRFTDRLSPSILIFFLIVRFLQLLEKLGAKPKGDGWRRVTQSYLRTEQAKFVLTSFGLDFWSDKTPDKICALTPDLAKQHLIKRLISFLGRHQQTRWELQWSIFSAKRQRKDRIDIVCAEFSQDGRIKNIEPYFDPNAHNSYSRAIQGQLKDILIESIIKRYNETRDLTDRKRPLSLKKRLRRWLLGEARIEDKDQAWQFVERILSADFIQFEIMPLDPFGRLSPPRFIKFKHPGFAFLNILCRFTYDLRQVDLWVQFNHIAADGVPMQEVLEELEKEWGKYASLKFPAPNYKNSKLLAPCSSQGVKSRIYQVNDFIDFQPFLEARRELNIRYAERIEGAITVAALLIWRLAQHRAFRGVKFALTVDIPATNYRERTLGCIFTRPSIYFDDPSADNGFIKFQQEFNREVYATKNRRSQSYRLLESYALTPPIMYSATLKLMPAAVREFCGTVGITIIKNSAVFIAPYSDVHSQGFIALGNMMLPAEAGSQVCSVSIKGPGDKVINYLDAIREVASAKNKKYA